MNDDRRTHPRLPVEVEVEVHLPDRPMRVLRTADLSHGGLLLIADEGDHPPLGTPVWIKVTGTLGNDEPPPLVQGRVVRHVDDGYAVVFEEQ